MKYKLSVFLLFLYLCAACGNSKSNGTQKREAQADTLTKFVLPSIPPTLAEPELRADFLVKHYWDNVNFADTNYVHHPEVTEQAWADYCDLLNHVPLKTAREAIRKMIDRSNANKIVFVYITDLADKYLYDPNSPMRNEEYYIPVLEAMIASPILDETEKIRPQARLQLAQKNRIGTKALNFTYTLASGAQGNLYQLKADHILLFINNPGCHACAETINLLKQAPAINQALAKRKLQILSVYPDVDLEEWHRHLVDFPKEWINGYDKKQMMETKNLYDLKAIPTLYLLDTGKIVLLKDVTVAEIEEYLNK